MGESRLYGKTPAKSKARRIGSIAPGSGLSRPHPGQGESVGQRSLALLFAGGCEEWRQSVGGHVRRMPEIAQAKGGFKRLQ